MEQKKQKQQGESENYRQWGCCEFKITDRTKRYRMMPFPFNRFGNFFYCRSWMKNRSIRLKNKS